MTLDEYINTNGIEYRRLGRAIVIADRPRYNLKGLYHLSDYFVSTLRNGSIWLLPKP